MTQTERIVRVFPRRTSYTPDDGLGFVGAPGDDGTLFDPHTPPPAHEITGVHVSVIFSWDLPRAYRLAETWRRFYRGGVEVRVGGPALRSPVNAFTAGLYVRQGITYTSRGCDGACPWCQVRDIEGRHRQLEPFAAGHVIADNDFLGCSVAHREAVYEMLLRQDRHADFRGGLSAAKLTPLDATWIRHLRIAKSGLWFACDTPGALGPLARAAALLGPWSREKLRCYCLIGFDPDETPKDADDRCRAVWRLGFIPFAQFYRAPGEFRRRRWPDEWAAVAKRWARPALARAYMRGAGRATHNRRRI